MPRNRTLTAAKAAVLLGSIPVLLWANAYGPAAASRGQIYATTHTLTPRAGEGVTIQTSPPFLLVSVDGGAPSPSPLTVGLSLGSHTIGAVPTQTSWFGTQYAFTSWSDGGAVSHSITVGDSLATYTATFRIQYQLLNLASPAIGGTVAPASGGFYDAGATVAISATAINRYRFASWSGSVANANLASTTVTMTGPQTITANFTTSTVPIGQVIVQGDVSILVFPLTTTCPPTLNICAQVPNPTPGYMISLFSADPTVTAYRVTVRHGEATDVRLVTYPRASTWVATAVYTDELLDSIAVEKISYPPTSITIQTVPSGLQFGVDGGSPLTAPQTVSVLPGTHTVAVAPIQPGAAGTQYVFTGWSDGGAASHSVTLGDASILLTASFKTQYQLTASAVPPNGGAVVTPGGNFYDAGANAAIIATANSGYRFAFWIGHVAEPDTPATTVTMDGPQTVTAVFTVSTVPTGAGFVPVTPCRVLDTRGPDGPFGGPAIPFDSVRLVAVPQSACGVPPNAVAYALNITVAPRGPLIYLTLWPTGQPQPLVSTLNSFDGRVVANAAIVPAGENGAISVFVSNTTDVIIDINGYFATADTPNSLAFYTVTPCRVVDTRGNGLTGLFGPPLLNPDSVRSFPIPSGACSIPATALAYSLNITVVPHGPLGYLTVWGTDLPQPLVSTLNSYDGSVVANAAIVPAGTGGGIRVFVTGVTDLIIDINGYFAPPGESGALYFYPAVPCRVVDTRPGQSTTTGLFGPPALIGGDSRTFPVPQGACAIPAGVGAYSMNVTVVPPGPLIYLTAWPAGQPQPVVSTLNSFAGKVVANAAIVPAGTNDAVSIFVSDPTDLILDLNGYFASSVPTPVDRFN